jgi:quinol monooxygenase YgiN
MINVVAKLVINPTYLAQGKELLFSLIPPTIVEKGCISYILHQDIENSDIFFFIEKWESKQDLDAHLSNTHMVNFAKEIQSLIISPLEVNVLDAIS